MLSVEQYQGLEHVLSIIADELKGIREELHDMNKEGLKTYPHTVY